MRARAFPLILSLTLSLLLLQGCGGRDECDTVIIPPPPSAYLYDAWFADEIDNDSDSFSSKFRLVWDADCECGSLDVFADLYYRRTGTAGWLLFGTTRTYTISGSSAEDTYAVLLNGDTHSSYDYRIVLFRNDGVLLDSLDPSSDADLYAHREETPDEDLSLQGYGYFYDAWFEDEIDNDGDGYPSQFAISWDADAASGSMNVYVEIHYRESGAADWLYVGTTETYTITGSNWDDSYYVVLEGDPRGFYDYLLVLYHEDGVELDWVDPSLAPLLGSHPEETPEED